MTDVDGIVQGDGGTTRVRATQNADQVAMVVAWRVAQRVLADHSTADLHVDVSTCRKRWKLMPTGASELERADVQGFFTPVSHDDFKHPWIAIAIWHESPGRRRSGG